MPGGYVFCPGDSKADGFAFASLQGRLSSVSRLFFGVTHKQPHSQGDSLPAIRKHFTARCCAPIPTPIIAPIVNAKQTRGDPCAAKSGRKPQLS
jgi:hypothetical protein